MALLSSTLSVEPEIDDSATRDAKNELADKLGGFADTTTGRRVGRRAGRVFGGSNILAGAGGVAGGVAGAVGGLGLAAIGGLLAAVEALQRTSPLLSKQLGILRTAMSLFFRPFGNVLGSTIIPFARSALQMAKRFNALAADKGLKVAIAEFLFGNPLKVITTLLGVLTGGIAGASIGALMGALLGSVVPGIGTAVGAVVGAKVGAVIGAIMGPFFAQASGFLKKIAKNIIAIPNTIINAINGILGAIEATINSIPGISGVSIGRLGSPPAPSVGSSFDTTADPEIKDILREIRDLLSENTKSAQGKREERRFTTR